MTSPGATGTAEMDHHNCDGRPTTRSIEHAHGALTLEHLDCNVRLSGSVGIATSMVGTDAWVIPHGDLDIANKAELESALTNAAAYSQRYVFVDLTDVTFLDASGIAAMVRAANALNCQGRRLKLLGAAGQVQHVLDVTRMNEFFGIDADLLNQPHTTGL